VAERCAGAALGDDALKRWFGPLLVAASIGAPAAEPLPLRMYDVTTLTGMPHLDENLRYATVTERRCVDPQDLSRLFWMLGDVSLQDCKLVKTSQTATEAEYRLQCSGGHGTSGQARWALGAEALSGTLDVRLGGKNMTFWQRISARPVGPC
jgi:hypothetical protein